MGVWYRVEGSGFRVLGGVHWPSTGSCKDLICFWRLWRLITVTLVLVVIAVWV